MWTRAELKDRAKEVFASCRWPAIGVSLIYAALSGGSSSGGGNSSGSGSSSGDLSSTFSNIDATILMIIVAAVGMAVIIGFLVKIFATNPLEVGVRRFFIKAREEEANFGDILFGFKNNYMGNVVTQLLRKIYTFLWSLLFIIPGIVKGLEYSMIPYILADNPDIDRENAFKLSKKMTDGQKWDIFVLGLSFIPWVLLTIITCGIVGVFFYLPYQNCTYAELYAVLKADLVSRDGEAARLLGVENDIVNGEVVNDEPMF